MKLDLNEIAHSPGILYTYQVEGEHSQIISSELRSAEVILHEPVKGKITFTNTGNLILARGELQTSLDLECIRCLSHFASDQTIKVEEQFPLNPDPLSGTDGDAQDRIDILVDPDFDLVDGVFEDDMLDLTELIRQNLIVAAPMHAVCDEQCKGLCMHCGKNLNEGVCKCVLESNELDHPLREALRGWDKQ